MKRLLEVSTRGTRLSRESGRIQIRREDETLASICPEDISVVILGSSGVSLSSGVLQAIGDAGGAVLVCDESALPCGMYLPLNHNSLHSERIRLQTGISAPLRKNLWARVVRAKVRLQAALLPEGPEQCRLRELADGVRSGDETQVESRAARVYWPKVFAQNWADPAKPFRRKREGSPPNALLNYGYAVLRAAMARALCAAGLAPALGLQHHNRYSGFCLADDLMEPYRPFVDSTVRGLVAAGQLEIDKESKLAMIGALRSPVVLAEGRFALGDAMERTASSLALSMERQVKEGVPAPAAAEELILPEPEFP